MHEIPYYDVVQRIFSNSVVPCFILRNFVAVTLHSTQFFPMCLVSSPQVSKFFVLFTQSDMPLARVQVLLNEAVQ